MPTGLRVMSNNFSQENLTDLLEGELILNEKIYQFLGKSFNFESIKKNRNFNKINFGDSNIFYEDGINLKIDQQNKLLEIIQNEVGSRAYIINGTLSDLKIKFYGLNNEITNAKPKNFPNDSNGLTGCLSLINLEVKNIHLFAQKFHQNPKYCTRMCFLNILSTFVALL